ncbi:hypothetical protein [Chitinophaga sp. YIM B06452]|uniref:hypothetical protein n=1 Tax=Chitinophaga sp. YIM B06452 TaxID=3082158 RepID=UPI0031FF0285
MKKIILLSAIAFGFFGCKKEGAGGTKPILTFKSVTMEDVPVEVEQVEFYFNLQDGDGDTEGNLYFLDLYRMDTATDNGTRDPYEFIKMPSLEIHKGTKINAELTLIMGDASDQTFIRLRQFGSGNPPPNKVDTSQLKVFIKDNAGNSSDTLLLPKVAIHFP